MNRNGHYGPYGGSYVAETLAQPLDELASAYFEAREDPSFRREFEELLRDYVGRESPITVCRRLSAALGAPRRARACTEWLPPPSRRSSGCPARSTWARLTWIARRRTWSA